MLFMAHVAQFFYSMYGLGIPIEEALNDFIEVPNQYDQREGIVNSSYI